MKEMLVGLLTGYRTELITACTFRTTSLPRQLPFEVLWKCARPAKNNFILAVNSNVHACVLPWFRHIFERLLLMERIFVRRLVTHARNQERNISCNASGFICGRKCSHTLLGGWSRQLHSDRLSQREGDRRRSVRLSEDRPAWRIVARALWLTSAPPALRIPHRLLHECANVVWS